MEPNKSKDQSDLNLPSPTAADTANSGSSMAPTPPNTAAPGAQSPPTPAAVPPNAALSNSPAVADDNDLIEKEWVDKAKTIVEKNKDDPYSLNKEINQMKADYIKKRYNKDIKLSDE